MKRVRPINSDRAGDGHAGPHKRFARTHAQATTVSLWEAANSKRAFMRSVEHRPPLGRPEATDVASQSATRQIHLRVRHGSTQIPHPSLFPTHSSTQKFNPSLRIRRTDLSRWITDSCRTSQRVCAAESSLYLRHASNANVS